MHLAGDMLLHGLQHATKADLSEFLKQVDSYISTQITNPSEWREKEIVIAWKAILGDVAHFAHHPRSGPSLDLTEKDRLLVNILWQAVRLAALIHDVGHFPLSHLFEYAFSDFFAVFQDTDNPFENEYSKKYETFRKSLTENLRKELPKTAHPIGNLLKKYPLHEMWGAILFQDWRPEGTEGSERCFYNVVFHLAKVIALVNPITDRRTKHDPLDVFRCMHSLVSGDLDADRLDYCVRDPQSSGLELGAIDVARIVRSMILVRDRRRFAIIPDVQALSALESFFHQRYLIYRYLVYHHNVVRLDGVAQEIVFRFLTDIATAGRPDPLIDIFDKFGLWVSSPTPDGPHFLGRGGFEFYDDAWLRTLMMQCLLTIRSAGQPTSEDRRDLALLLETLLFRQTQNIVTMWKRESDYLRTVLELKKKTKKGQDKIQKILSPKAMTTRLHDEFLGPVKDKLKKHGITLVHRILKPKVPDQTSGALMVFCDGKPTECEKVSNYLKSLSEQESAPTIFIAFVAKNLKVDRHLSNKCRKIVTQQLEHFVQRQLSSTRGKMN